MLRYLLHYKLCLPLNLLVDKLESNIHDDQYHITLLEVEVDPSIVSCHGTWCIHELHSQRVHLLVFRFDCREYFETELCTFITCVRVVEFVVQQVSEQLSLAGLGWTHHQNTAPLQICVPLSDHTDLILSLLVELNASVASDVYSHF